MPERKFTREEAGSLDADARAQRSLTPPDPARNPEPAAGDAHPETGARDVHPAPGSRARDIREEDTTEYDESNAGEGPD